MNWRAGYDNMPAQRITEAGASLAVVPDLGGSTETALDEMLPMDLIREHTKTDDVPSVSDAQLALYRRAAAESAEQYTGLYLLGTKVITENVDAPTSRRTIERGYYTFNTRFPVSDGRAFIYGTKHGSREISTAPGSSRIRVPLMLTDIDMTSCCGGPCSSQPSNWGMKIMYRTGFAKCNNIPAGILVGMLKFVAWCIAHPGDSYAPVEGANKPRTNDGTIQGTNNAAWASGALELWRQYDPDAV